MAEDNPGLASAVGAAIAATTNEFGRGAGAAPLSWKLWPYTADDSTAHLMLLGRINPGEGETVAGIADPWVRLFTLEEAISPAPGTLEYRGQVDRFHVTVWGVTDQDAFEGGV